VEFAANAVVAQEEPLFGRSCATVVTPLTAPGVFPQLLRIDLDCTLAHLGRASGVAMQTVNVTGQSGPTLMTTIENTTTYQAANGDVLNPSFAGTALINVETGDVRYIGTETSTEGPVASSMPREPPSCRGRHRSSPTSGSIRHRVA
jgi:hypothetical protein